MKNLIDIIQEKLKLTKDMKIDEYTNIYDIELSEFLNVLKTIKCDPSFIKIYKEIPNWHYISVIHQSSKPDKRIFWKYIHGVGLRILKIGRLDSFYRKLTKALNIKNVSNTSVLDVSELFNGKVIEITITTTLDKDKNCSCAVIFASNEDDIIKIHNMFTKEDNYEDIEINIKQLL